MHDAAYQSQETDGVILFDASNAFNSLNHQVALRNIQRHCLSIATFLINTYQSDIDLFIDGEQFSSMRVPLKGTQ